MTDESCERTRLHSAAHAGDWVEVEQLLAAGHPVNAFDELGKTPLHYAAEGGQLKVMQLLIAAGADVNAHDERWAGHTPLGEVAGNCSYEVAKLLIEAGADPTIAGGMGLTPLHQAQQRKRPECVRVKEFLEQEARNPGSGRRRKRR